MNLHLLTFLLLLTIPLWAQDVIDIAVRGISNAQNDGAQKDRLEAIMDAKRQACEKAGLKIQSSTTVENFQTTYDLIESRSEAVLLPGFQIIDNGYAADGTYSVVLVGKVKVLANMVAVKEVLGYSIALRNQALQISDEDKKFYWAALLEKDNRKDLLEQSLLLALEAHKREPSAETEKNLRETMALLPEPVKKFEITDGVNTLKFSRDAKFIAVASDDAAALVIDLSTGKSPLRYEHNDEVICLDLSPDNKYMITGSRDSTATIWQIEPKNQLAKTKHNGYVTTVKYNPVANLVASASPADSAVLLWNPANGQEALRIRHNNEKIRQIVFSPNGQMIATIAGDLSYSASENNTARIWRVQDGELITSVTHEKTPNKSMVGIEAIAFSPDGKILATASDDYSVRLWNIPDGSEIIRLRHRSAVVDVAFSDQGDRIVTASRDQTARVWQVNTGTELCKVIHGDILRTARLSSDGRYLATGSLDRTARLYEVETGIELARMVHSDAVNIVSFSPDGNLLATGPQSWDRYLRMWKLFPDNLMKEGCRILSRNLSPDEWKKYLGDEAYNKTCPDLP